MNTTNDQPAQSDDCQEILRVAMGHNGIRVLAINGQEGAFPWREVMKGLTATIEGQHGTEVAVATLAAAFNMLAPLPEPDRVLH